MIRPHEERGLEGRVIENVEHARTTASALSCEEQRDQARWLMVEYQQPLEVMLEDRE